MKISQLQQLMEVIPHNVAALDPVQRDEYLIQIGMDPGGIYQELEMSSRFADTHTDVSTVNSHVKLHSHMFYELLYCVDAVDVEYLVGAERYKLQRGDIVMISPGVSHRPLLPEIMVTPYKRHILWISMEFMENLRQTFPELRALDTSASVMLRTADSPWAYLGDLFQSGVTEAERRYPGWEAALLGNTVTLLACLHRAFLDRASGTMKAEKSELLEQLLAYVEQHLSERITLSDAAHQFFVSESTITQLFRKKMGVSFYRFITQRRLITAKSLIEKGISLNHVAAQSGFGDYSVFYRAFKQEYGISPRQFRKLQ